MNQSNHSFPVTMKRRPLLGAVLLMSCLSIAHGIPLTNGTPLLAADPSISKPGLVLPMHGFIEEAKPLFEQCEKDDTASTKTYEGLIKANKPPSKEAVNQLSTIEKRMARYAERLMILGESTGAEFDARQKHHRKQFEEAYYAFSNHPKHLELRQQAVIELQRSTSARQKKSQEIAKTFESDPFAAEKLLDAALDELESKAGILLSDERGPFSEYENVRNQVYPACGALRRRNVGQAIQKFGAETASEFDKYLAKLQSAAASLKGGSVTWEDKPVDAIVFLDQAFRDSNVWVIKVQKLIGMQSWIQNPKIGTYGAAGPPPPPDTKWFDRLRTLKAEMIKLVEGVIEADSRAIPPARASARLAQYVQTLGRQAHRVDGDEWINPFDKAILNAAKKLGVGDDFSNYQRATNDALAWHERFAQKQETILAKQGVRLADAMVKASNKTGSDPGYFFLGQGTPPPAFHDPSYQSLPALASRMGKETIVTVGNVMRMDSESPIWLSKWDNFVYARVTDKFVKPELAKRFASGLWVDETHLPLSVRAASAIYTAERGDRLTVGGIAGEVTVEGAATRLQTLPDIGSAFVGYSQAVTIPKSAEAPRCASLRVAVSPRWYRHRYFVVPAL